MKIDPLVKLIRINIAEFQAQTQNSDVLQFAIWFENKIELMKGLNANKPASVEEVGQKLAKELGNKNEN